MSECVKFVLIEGRIRTRHHSQLKLRKLCLGADQMSLHSGYVWMGGKKWEEKKRKERKGNEKKKRENIGVFGWEEKSGKERK